MKKRKLFILLAAVTAGSLLLNGCSLDLTSVNQEDTTLSAEMENENLNDGTIQMYSFWYDVEKNALASATVTFSNDGEVIFTGTTDEGGSLELCSIPGNTALTCTVTDTTGTAVGESQIVFKISSDYTAFTIYPVHGEEDSEHVVEVPADKTEIRAAIFVTEEGRISFASVSPYVEDAGDTEGSDGTSDEDSSDSDASDTSDDDSSDSDTSDGDSSDGTSDDGASDDASSDNASDDTSDDSSADNG